MQNLLMLESQLSIQWSTLKIASKDMVLELRNIPVMMRRNVKA